MKKVNQIGALLLVLGIVASVLIVGCSDDDVKNTSSIPSDITYVPQEGGAVTFEDKFTIEFPQNAFSKKTAVEIAKSTNPETAKLIEIATDLFRIGEKIGYELRILTDNIDTDRDVNITWNIPDSFINSIPKDHQIELFIQLWQEGGEEVLDNFELYPSTYDSGKKKIYATLPAYVFTNQRRADKKYEAILTLYQFAFKTQENMIKIFFYDSNRILRMV